MQTDRLAAFSLISIMQMKVIWIQQSTGTTQNTHRRDVVFELPGDFVRWCFRYRIMDLFHSDTYSALLPFRHISMCKRKEKNNSPLSQSVAVLVYLCLFYCQSLPVMWHILSSSEFSLQDPSNCPWYKQHLDVSAKPCFRANTSHTTKPEDQQSRAFLALLRKEQVPICPLLGLSEVNTLLPGLNHLKSFW